MRNRTTHPGVNLTQRAKGSVWNIRYFDTRSGQRIQVLKSTLSNDHDIATRIAENIHAFLKSPELWDNPPEGYHPRAYELLGLTVGDGHTTKSLERSLRILSVPARFAGVDISPSLQRAQQELETLKDALKRAQQTANDWKRRAISAEGQLAQMGRRANKARAAIEGLTLGDALATWSQILTGDPDYVRDQQITAGMFVRRFGSNTALSDIAGQESKIDLWIRGLKKTVNVGDKKLEKSLSATRRKEVRRVVLSFMQYAGVELDRKAIKRPSLKDVRNDRGPIRWLTREQAKAVAAELNDPYFHDCFVVQLALGLRPDELLTLKRADFSKTGDTLTVTLSPLDHLTLKEGSRSIKVPTTTHKIVEKRLEAHDILFPYISRSGKSEGKTWDSAKSFDRRYLAALRKAGLAAGVPFTMDCRIPRRTCATLLLSAGTAPKIVADILGDNLQTVIEHYGASIPGTNDPSAAAI